MPAQVFDGDPAAPPLLCMEEWCQEPAAWGWKRYATAEEISHLRATGEVHHTVPDEDITVPVYACDTHKLVSWDENAMATHQSTCAAPTTCDCEPEFPPWMNPEGV